MPLGSPIDRDSTRKTSQREMHMRRGSISVQIQGKTVWAAILVVGSSFVPLTPVPSLQGATLKRLHRRGSGVLFAPSLFRAESQESARQTGTMPGKERGART